MHRDDRCESGTTLLSFLTGTVIGAGLALLYAPKTGVETREILSDYGNDLRDKTRNLNLPDSLRGSAEDIADRGRDLINRGRDLIEQGTEMATSGKDYLDDKKNALSEAIEAGRNAMLEEKEELTASMEKDS
ncbi:MAG: YtxH domain-containing protein [Thermodesulfobacteriota bacterium]